jgi:hypothetical protein
MQMNMKRLILAGCSIMGFQRRYGIGGSLRYNRPNRNLERRGFRTRITGQQSDNRSGL